MTTRTVRIGVVAPGGRIEPELPARVVAFAQGRPGSAARVEIVFHPQCHRQSGHFAGDDRERADAFVAVANDPNFDALWFARGGYGACRIAEQVLARLEAPARAKIYLGYSDAGSLLAGLYRAGFPRVAHGPMAGDLRRPGGEAAVGRALDFLATESVATLEPSLVADTPAIAFNVTILSQLLGTPLEPDIAGHVLMLEEVSEAHYRFDRALFHITSNPSMRRVKGIRLGRVSEIPPNDPPFGLDEVAITRAWCARAGIPYLGRADIGHDSDNKIVPFGQPWPLQPSV